jgi:hypothetical protein
MNEWSTYMNLAYRYVSSRSVPNWGPSDWIHNGMPGSCMLTIRSSSHRNLIRSINKSITFPDQVIRPSSVLLIEGDFTTVFAEHTGQYDIPSWRGETTSQCTGEMVHCWGPSDWIHNGMPGSCGLTTPRRKTSSAPLHFQTKLFAHRLSYS